MSVLRDQINWIDKECARLRAKQEGLQAVRGSRVEEREAKAEATRLGKVIDELRAKRDSIRRLLEQVGE